MESIMSQLRIDNRHRITPIDTHSMRMIANEYIHKVISGTYAKYFKG